MAYSQLYHSIFTVLIFLVPLSSSHLVVIKPGPILSDALASSPILRAEDGTSLAPVGTGFEFGIDPSEDPELAMVSVPIVGVLHYLGLKFCYILHGTCEMCELCDLLGRYICTYVRM